MLRCTRSDMENTSGTGHSLPAATTLDGYGWIFILESTSPAILLAFQVPLDMCNCARFPVVVQKLIRHELSDSTLWI